MKTLRHYFQALVGLFGLTTSHLAPQKGTGRAKHGPALTGPNFPQGGLAPTDQGDSKLSWINNFNKFCIMPERLIYDPYGRLDHDFMKNYSYKIFEQSIYCHPMRTITAKKINQLVFHLPIGEHAPGQDGSQKPASVPGAKVSDNRPEPGQAT
jgi:hypothetical protein